MTPSTPALRRWREPITRTRGVEPVINHLGDYVTKHHPHPLTEERTFQLRFEIPRPETKKKSRKVKRPKPTKPKPRKPRLPTRTAEERGEARQEYERTRRKNPERTACHRLYQQRRAQEAKGLGLCTTCRRPAIPDQTRCETCAEAHRQSRRRSDAKRKAAVKETATTG